MAEQRQHVLSGGDPDRGVRVLTYGKCEKPEYRQQGLWYVHVPRITEQSTTFLITEYYIHPRIFDDFEIDLEKWRAVAKKVIPGADWNPAEECLWSEMPFYVYTLSDGTPVRYGLSRTQSPDHPDRELWYVVLGADRDAPINHGQQMFVVDKLCTEPDYLERMGTDVRRWTRICWSHPDNTPWHAHIDQIPELADVMNYGRSDPEPTWWQRLVGLFPG